MKFVYPAVFHKSEKGGYEGYFPDLACCEAKGETLDEAQAGKVSEKEKEYERLWSGFFRSISIKERENPRCQRNHLPLRYRDQMPEFRGRSREPHRDQRNARAGDEVPGTGT